MIAISDPLARLGHLYHFTNKINFAGIRKHGAILSTKMLKDLGETFSAGGDDASISLDESTGMDRYVHLCFDLRHPMVFRIKQRKPDADMYYLQIDRRIAYESGVMFSTGIAYASGVEIVSLSEACERNMLDFDAYYTYYPWVGDGQARRSAAEKCEILVPDAISIDFVRNLPNG